MSFIYHIKAKILSRKEVVPKIYLMSVKAPEIAQEALPGQFIHIKCSQDNYPLLRRPLSIHRVDKEKGEIFILFQAVGEGTKLLADRTLNIPVIGMGGITKVEDALEFIIAGARAIEIGTANFVNTRVTIEIIEGIKKYLIENKMKDVNELVGSMKI